MLYSIVIIIRRMGITFESHKSEFRELILILYSMAVVNIIALDLLGKKVFFRCSFMRGNYRPVSMMVADGS